MIEVATSYFSFLHEIEENKMSNHVSSAPSGFLADVAVIESLMKGDTVALRRPMLFGSAVGEKVKVEHGDITVLVEIVALDWTGRWEGHQPEADIQISAVNFSKQ